MAAPIVGTILDPQSTRLRAATHRSVVVRGEQRATGNSTGPAPGVTGEVSFEDDF